MQDVKKAKGYKFKKEHVLPYTRANYFLFAAAMVVIVLGYVTLTQPPWNNFWSLTVAPILLVLGYCVLIPVALLYQKRKKKPAPAQEQAVQQAQQSA